MNKNMMMVVLLMGMIEVLNAAISSSPTLYNLIPQNYTFKNMTANTFTFKYPIGSKPTGIVYHGHFPSDRIFTIYNTDVNNSDYKTITQGKDESYLKPVTLSSNLDRNNTQTVTMVSNSGVFTISTHYKKDLKKTYRFQDFNATDTFSISLKGGDIHVYDPSGKEIKPQSYFHF